MKVADRGGNEEQLICRKTDQRIPRKTPVCPVPDGACKYRAECMIYAFERLEKMDKHPLK